MTHDAKNLAIDPRTPVLIGAGVISQRLEDPLAAVEPIELMIRAARASGDDAGVLEALAGVERVYVPHGRWAYRNPGRLIGEAIGATNPTTISALPGISQQTLLSDAASVIDAGEIRSALVVGGEAGHRLLRARVEGVQLTDTPCEDEPDELLVPGADIIPDYEQQAGLGVMPVGYYALIDSAWRRARGLNIETHRDRMADRYHAFSTMGAKNPNGWAADIVSAAAVRDGRMLAFPYTKHHVSDWNVDQASALLLTSVAEAQRLGVDPSRWLFPQALIEANHMVNITARADLDRCVGAEIAGRAALAAAGCTVDDLDLIELYSCFPVAIDTYAVGLGLDDSTPPDRLSFTGAMPFAGGPFNNFVLHTTAQLAHRLRGIPNGRGLVSTVSGVLTKQGIAVWGRQPNPSGFQFADVTAETVAATEVRDVAIGYGGLAVTVATTVMHGRAGPERGIAIVDLPDGRRSIVSTSDAATMETMQRDETCGRHVEIADGVLRFAS
jgi:acetyl-CoA C-acetyltransferase